MKRGGETVKEAQSFLPVWEKWTKAQMWEKMVIQGWSIVDKVFPLQLIYCQQLGHEGP